MFVVKGLKMVSMNRTSTLVSGSIHSSKISDLRDLFEMYAKNKDIADSLFRYSPKEELTDSILFYFLYVQPVLVFFVLLCFVGMTIIVKFEKEVRENFLFIIVQELFEILQLLIPIPVQIAILGMDRQYLLYQYCELYRSFTLYIPHGFYMVSQWMKVILTVHRFVIFYAPLKSKLFFSRRKMIICIVVVPIVLFCVSTIAQYDYKFEKSSAIDSETHEPVYYCYISNDPILGEYRRLIVFIVSSLIPVIAMIVFGIALVYQIRKMIAFRRQTVQVPNSSLNYLNIVVCWCTLIYIVFSIPRSIIDGYNVYQWISNNDMEIQNIERFINIMSCITIINHVACALNIPFTLIIFLCLNRNIRVKFVRLFRKATSKHKKRQITIVGQVNLSVTPDRSHGKE